MVKAHTVMEELIIYLCNEEAMAFMEVSDERVATDSKNLGYSEDWVLTCLMMKILLFIFQ